jgi:hypothetical protein
MEYFYNGFAVLIHFFHFAEPNEVVAVFIKPAVNSSQIPPMQNNQNKIHIKNPIV